MSAPQIFLTIRQSVSPQGASRLACMRFHNYNRDDTFHPKRRVPQTGMLAACSHSIPLPTSVCAHAPAPVPPCLPVLQDHLNSLNKQTLGIERSVREIATLNQMFSTAVLAQAEQLEELYMNALDASHNIVIGNREIVKTLAVNKSSSRYILALFAVASLCLLFYDWFNS